MKYIPFITSLIIWLAFDMITKAWVSSSAFKPVQIIKNFFFFTSQKNTGIAFSIGVPYVAQIILSFVLIAVLLYFAYDFLRCRNTNTFGVQVIFGIIVGGAIGNLINRIQLGYVIDFIALRPIPIFNIADVGITLGLFSLFVLMLNKKHE